MWYPLKPTGRRRPFFDQPNDSKLKYALLLISTHTHITHHTHTHIYICIYIYMHGYVKKLYISLGMRHYVLCCVLLSWLLIAFVFDRFPNKLSNNHQTMIITFISTGNQAHPILHTAEHHRIFHGHCTTHWSYNALLSILYITKTTFFHSCLSAFVLHVVIVTPTASYSESQ